MFYVTFLKIMLFFTLVMPVIPGINLSQEKKPKSASKRTWEYVGKAGSDYWFRNIRTVRRTSEGRILIWFRIAMPAPDMEYAARSDSVVWSEILEENGHSLQLWEFNCQNGEMRPLQDVSYDPNGKVTSQRVTPNSSWNYPIPDSIGEATFRAACRHVTRKQ